MQSAPHPTVQIAAAAVQGRQFATHLLGNQTTTYPYNRYAYDTYICQHHVRCKTRIRSRPVTYYKTMSYIITPARMSGQVTQILGDPGAKALALSPAGA